jgi:alpha-tubulin suppressor-like RCC1 family protein
VSIAACTGAFGSGRDDDRRKIDPALPDALATAPLPRDGVAPSEANVVAIDVSREHACAALSTGEVACWGSNSLGQLGVLLPKASSSPVRVADVDRAIDVRAGQGVSCARRADAPVACWGKGSGVVIIPGTEGAIDIATAESEGPYDACAARSDGVVCWDMPSGRATPLAGFPAVSELVVGEGLVCGVTIAGRVACLEAGGQDWLRETPPAPQVVELRLGLDKVVDVALSEHLLCARDVTGKVTCQTRRTGDFRTINAPAAATNLLVTMSEPCVELADGTLKCWNAPQNEAIESPTQGESLRRVACGEGLCCGITSDGGAACRGFNFDGELGDGVPLERREPTLVEGVMDAVELVAHESTCALTSAGEVICWGEDFSLRGRAHPVAREAKSIDLGAGLLVLGRSGSLSKWEPSPPPGCPIVAQRPVPCEGTPAWSQLALPQLGRARAPRAMGNGHVCAITDAGALACLLRDPARPGQRWSIVPGVSDAKSVVASFDAACAILESGGVTCVRDPRSTGRTDLVPKQVVGLDGVRHVAASDTSFYAERADGSVSRFRVGDATARPATIRTLIDVSGISARGVTACGMRGTVTFCWSADDGALDRDEPKHVALPSPAKVVAAGRSHACAIVEGGRVYCWGNDRNGAVGAGRVLGSTTPIRVKGLGPRRP